MLRQMVQVNCYVNGNSETHAYKVHHSGKQLGLAGSSNAVVSKARAPILARMDADDLAHPDRLRRQLNILESHPDIVVVGTLNIGIDASGRVVRPARSLETVASFRLHSLSAWFGDVSPQRV